MNKLRIRRNTIVNLVYAVLGVLSSVFLIIAFVWASKGDVSGEITKILSAEVKAAEDTRTEYIVGEEVLPEHAGGATITVLKENGKTVTPDLSECTIECDTATAGKKPVVISWRDGTTLYRGSYTVTVFGVKHLAIQPITQRTKLVYSTSDTQISSEGLDVWADLTGEPQTDVFEKPSSYPSVVRLTKEQYSVSCAGLGRAGVYDATVSVGQSSASYQIAIADTNGALEANTLSFTDETDGNSSLTLHLFSRSSVNDSSEARATGYYELIRANGNYQVFAFDYAYAPEGWKSTFSSAGGVEEKIGEQGELRLTVYNSVYTASVERWHDVVLHWPHTAERVELKFDNAKFFYSVGAEGFTQQGITVTQIKFADGQREAVQSDGRITFSVAEGQVFSDCGTKEVTVNYEDATYSGENALKAVFTVCIVPNASDAASFIPASECKNVDGTNEAMRIYIGNDRSGGNGITSVSGYVVLSTAEGEYTMYPFGYAMNETTYESTFDVRAEGLKLSVDNVHSGRLDVYAGSAHFTVSGGVWHNRIIGRQGLILNTDGVRKYYAAGETFVKDGLIVTFADANGVQTALTEYTVSTPDTTKPGVKTVTVSLQRDGETYSDSFEIFVIPSWNGSKLPLVNNSGTRHQAELFVTSLTAGSESYSWLLYQRCDGCFEMYYVRYQLIGGASQFTFYDKEGGEEIKTVTAIADNGRGGILALSVDGLDFTAGYSDWHKTIIGVNW